MRVGLLLKTFLVIAFLVIPFSKAQSSHSTIEIKEEDGFLKLHIPLISFRKDEKGSVVVLGEGKEGQSSQHIRLEFRPNRSLPRKGVTHTAKSCLISFNEELFRALAKHLSVRLPSSSFNLRPHDFDFVEAEGSLDNAEKLPVKLEVLDLFDDDLYSEWYIEIDVRKKMVVLSEKNNQYREAFVHTFIR